MDSWSPGSLVPSALAIDDAPPFLGVMSPRRKAWPFDLKFRLWRAETGKSISACSRETGVPYATLHGWTAGGVRPTAEGMERLATLTGLPASYWLDPAAPYPPPVDYFEVAGEVDAAIRGLTPEKLQRVLRLFRVPGDLDRALDLLDVAKRAPPGPRPAAP